MHDIRDLAWDTVINTSLISQQHNVDCCYVADHLSLNTDSKWIIVNLLLLISIDKANKLLSLYGELQ